jgi:cation diffusion facilitator CzcD-associated flavoprotein CzcO
MRRMLRRATERQLPAGYDVDTHFNPTYNPWDQRMCLVPEGDLFRAISSGGASVVTGAIERFTETGLLLADGRHLDADIVITATGLNLLAFGGIELAVDGREVELSETVGYKGMMLSGVPNFAFAVGYTNASWTLKADLVAEYICRLLGHMRERGYAAVTPVAPDPSQPTQPFLDLASGYVQRSVESFPRQGTVAPWRLNQNYPRDVRLLRHGPIEDAGVRFSRAPQPAARRSEQALAA